MKKITVILFLGLIVFCLPAIGQTTDEWLRQKSTQRKYLLQQVAALRTYGQYLKNGYGVIRDGSGLIKDITAGEFNLHREYFGSLKAVNPALLKNDKVEAILSMQQAMEQSRHKMRNKSGNTTDYNKNENRQFRKLLDGLESDCTMLMEDLLLVLTDGKLELTDDERIERIGKIHTATQNLYSIHRRTANMLWSIRSQREQEIKMLQQLLKMQGLQR